MAPTQAPYTNMRGLPWPPAEKPIPCQAFDLALRRELDAVIREAKGRAAKVAQPSDLGDLERWLTQRRKHIDRQYDYRYSVLHAVLGNLIREGRLAEQDLRGRTDDKLTLIRRQVTL